jgi:hypothetical protein
MGPDPRRGQDVSAPAQVTPLLEALRSFWPAPVTIELAAAGQRRSAHSTEFIVMPNARKPAMLLPAGSRQAAASAATRWGSGSIPAARLRHWGVVTALRLGLADTMFRDRLVVTPAQTLEADGMPAETGDLAGYLSTAIGTRVLLAVRTGSLRANRKPVLQVLGLDGTVLAFVKVGHDPLTRTLVRAEAAALVQVHEAELATVVAPVPLFIGDWQGLELLVLTPLPLARRPARRAVQVPVQALREVSGIGATRSTLLAAPFWQRLKQTSAELGPDTRDALYSVIDELEARHGGTELALGGWHGDWTPWNMQYRDGHVLLWDWERFTTGVPVGFDALHYRLNDLRVVRGLPMTEAVAGLLSGAAELLRPLEVDSKQATLMSLLYLLELGVRYLHDGQTPSGQNVRLHGTGLLGELNTALAERRTA